MGKWRGKQEIKRIKKLRMLHLAWQIIWSYLNRKKHSKWAARSLRNVTNRRSSDEYMEVNREHDSGYSSEVGFTSSMCYRYVCTRDEKWSGDHLHEKPPMKREIKALRTNLDRSCEANLFGDGVAWSSDEVRAAYSSINYSYSRCSQQLRPSRTKMCIERKLSELRCTRRLFPRMVWDREKLWGKEQGAVTSVESEKFDAFLGKTPRYAKVVL